MPEMTPEKTPEQQIEELKTGIGAIAETTYMFYSTLISKGLDEEIASLLTTSFIKSFVASIFRKGDTQ